MKKAQKILIIVGPTASGKSSLAITLARKLKGEVISADSRQVYKGLDIGTGKVTKKEMKGVPHHLLDVADPKKVFSVSDYKRLATEALEKILTKSPPAGGLPIIVGGTGFYVDALTGAASLPEVPPNKKLRKKLEKKSAEALFKLLQKKDPRRAKEIDPRNKVRVIRALEICAALGKVPTPLTRGGRDEVRAGFKTENTTYIWIGLTLPQDQLDQKIKKRLIERLDAGMIQEAKKLHVKGLSYKRMHALGLEYRYLALYLQKKISKTELIEQLFKEIRHYSKRQMTWFKTNKHIHWFTPQAGQLSASDFATIQKLLAE